MAFKETVAVMYRGQADAELAQLYEKTGIDLSELPPMMTAAELAPALRSSEGALAQDRYRNRGVPYVKLGRRIRYARADVARYLASNHSASR